MYALIIPFRALAWAHNPIPCSAGPVKRGREFLSSSTLTTRDFGNSETPKSVDVARMPCFLVFVRFEFVMHQSQITIQSRPNHTFHLYLTEEDGK